MKVSEFTRIFLPRLVLEVFGSGGAIWGFSEATGLRTPYTVWFWRPAAWTVGAIFFVRWILQILDFTNVSSVNDMKQCNVISNVHEEKPLVTTIESTATEYLSTTTVA